MSAFIAIDHSVPQGCATKLSKSEIQKDLETAQREYWEQMILPGVLEVQDIGLLLNRDSVDFILRIKKALEESKDLQKNVEARIRKNMRRFGDEKYFVVSTPADEVLKGFPEIELKWMFGNKEVVVPKAISLHLFHGWKKWREEAKADLKRTLLENVDLGKQYVAQIQVFFLKFFIDQKVYFVKLILSCFHFLFVLKSYFLFMHVALRCASIVRSFRKLVISN